MRIVIRKKLSTFILLIVLMNGVAALGLPTTHDEGNGTATAAPSINYDSYDYYVEELQVFMGVDTSGNIDVFEYINFTFNRGTYSMAYREIPHYGFDTLVGAMVENETGAVLKVGAKYEFEKFRGDYLIRWAFSPEKGPGNESFFISYSVTNAVESVTKDQLGIDWYVIGKDWTVPIKKMSIMLLLPWNVTESPLFDYKPDKANVTVVMDQTLINFTREDVKPKTPVRIVVYYPKSFDPTRNILTFLRENTFSVAAFLFLILTLIPLIMVIYKGFLSKVPPKILKPNAAIMADPPKLTTLIQGRYTPLAFFAGAVHLAKTGFLRVVDEGLSGDGQIWIDRPHSVNLGSILMKSRTTPWRCSRTTLFLRMGRLYSPPGQVPTIIVYSLSSIGRRLNASVWIWPFIVYRTTSAMANDRS